MRVEETCIPEVRIIHLDPHPDGRGMFVETYDECAFAKFGIETKFVLDAFSLSADKGTVRGLHFQTPPHAQAKLVRVVRGGIFDVVVDLRKDASTFGQHVAVNLIAGDWRQLLIPTGFAHGFCTLEDNTRIVYKMSDHHYQDHALGVLWKDPELAIDWPVSEGSAVLSEKDSVLPLLKNLPQIFTAASGGGG